MIANSPKSALSPFQLAEFEDNLVTRSLLVEERRQTRTARRVIAVCAMGLIAFVVWASVAPVHEVVTVSGTLVPSEQVRRVQHLEGGIVETVLAAPGDRVRAGQPLLRLDGAQLRAELAKSRVRQKSLSLVAERLRALASDDPEALVEEGSLDAILDSQRAAWQADRLHLAARIDVIDAQQRAKEGQRPALIAQREVAAEELAMLREQLARQEDALARGLVPRRERDELARSVLDMQRLIAEIDGAAAQIESDLAGITANRSELVAGLRRDALSQVADLEGQRAETATLIEQLSERLERLDVVAPVDGVVQSLAIDGPREVLLPGAVVAEIVPENGPVIARVEVPAERIGAVTAGGKARVRILTYDYTRFGALDAVIEHVSPSSSVNQNGQSVYEASLRLASDRVGPETAGLIARPGMTVSADITGGEKTVLQYLLKPLRVLSDQSLSEG